ncbi:MAG TPA: HEAT repeat domain-containing protein [Gemmatimonadota bacterium]|nr:HEAT repeat domain-containing protein [Gemmatimonadota bacterium]
MESVLVGSLVKGTLLLLAAFGVTSAMRGTSAAARHAVWSAALAGVVAIPLVTLAVPWRMSILPAGWGGAAIETPAPTTATTPVAEPSRSSANWPMSAPVSAAVEEPGGPASLSAGAIDAPEPWGPASGDGGSRFGLPHDPWRLALYAWLAIGALVLGRILVGMAWMWRLARRAEPLSGPAWLLPLGRVTERLDLRTAVRVVRSDAAVMPVTCGVIRPAVVLPLESEAWDEERREAVLLHELAHVRRGDLATHLVAWVACSLYWFHPLAWIAARRLRHESERACDDLVLGAGTRASEYATHLLDIVRAAGRGRAPVAAVPMAQRSSFEGRLLAILEPGVARHSLTPGRKAAVAAALALVVLPLAAMAPARPSLEAEELVAERAESADEPIRVDPAEGWTERLAPSGESVDSSSGFDTSADFDSETALDGMGPIQAEPGKDPKREAGADPRTVTALLTAMGDPDADVRETAAHALGGLDDPRAVDALVRALANDADAGVRKMAAWALGEIESPRAVPALSQAVRNDASPDVRSMAAWALGEIESEEAVPALGAALRDSSVEVRRMAIWALGEIESEEAVPWLIPAVRDADVDVRRKAVWALGEIESEAAVDALAGALSDSDAEVRKTAAWAIGEIESVEAVPALAQALADDNAEVRKTAAWAIGEIQPARAPQALIAALRDGNAEVRKTAAWAVGEIEDPSAAPALRPLLRDANKEVRKTAIWALTEMDDPIAYDMLIELLKDEDPEVRKQAAQALGNQ